MIHPDHVASVAGFVDRARAHGDTILRGGTRSPLGGADGLWYEPTLIEPASNDSEVVQSEIFGPVLTFQTFTDEADAIRLAVQHYEFRPRIDGRLAETPIRFTVSNPVAQYAPGMSGVDLLGAADLAMYQVKNSGRNNVAQFEPPAA